MSDWIPIVEAIGSLALSFGVLASVHMLLAEARRLREAAAPLVDIRSLADRLRIEEQARDAHADQAHELRRALHEALDRWTGCARRIETGAGVALEAHHIERLRAIAGDRPPGDA